MAEHTVSVCVRVCGKERFRLYIECAADKDGAIKKAVARAKREGLIPVQEKSWVIK